MLSDTFLRYIATNLPRKIGFLTCYCFRVYPEPEPQPTGSFSQNPCSFTLNVKHRHKHEGMECMDECFKPRLKQYFTRMFVT